ncbi:MAG: pyridoxine 5'-phosphate synthase [Candidatus Aceula meridiana]|nr:pyridoxine 5'-phosphate synthase [Candidatus Aceula meridiana]
MPKLGINVDHVATVRQAREGFTPDPVLAAKICEEAGAHSIVAHLREDRRHIHDRDIQKLKKTVKTRLNLEMSLNKDIVAVAIKIKPYQATLVPEKRQELTTEGGLDVIKNFTKIKRVTKILSQKGILVSLFIDPQKNQIIAAKRSGAKSIELHTGCYANAQTPVALKKEFKKIKNAVKIGNKLGLVVNAGHGLNYKNTQTLAKIAGIAELNIGHSIISQAIFVGLKKAVKDMLKLCKQK